MSIKAIECPDGVCHSHHGGHAVPRQAMQKNLEKHGKDWCEKLAERIYEMSVDTYSQTVMPSLHSAGWQRRHLDWEFKLAENDSEPDEALVEGIINATESFLRSSEVHRLFIQELVQGTFEEANDKKIIFKFFCISFSKTSSPLIATAPFSPLVTIISLLSCFEKFITSLKFFASIKDVISCSLAKVISSLFLTKFKK